MPKMRNAKNAINATTKKSKHKSQNCKNTIQTFKQKLKSKNTYRNANKHPNIQTQSQN